MFNATLAGHNLYRLHPDSQSVSRSSSRNNSIWNIQDIGKQNTSGKYKRINADDLEMTVEMMMEDSEEQFNILTENKGFLPHYQPCLYLSFVFSGVALTIFVIIYVAFERVNVV